jgi:hypothetical protein
MAARQAVGVPFRPVPTVSINALWSDGSGVRAARNGRRRTSSASTYSMPGTGRLSLPFDDFERATARA